MSAAFDERALMARVDDDLEFLAEMVEMLDEDSPALLDQIRDAVTAEDAEALARAAHAFKGVLSNFCAEPVRAAAIELERMGREGQLEAATAAVDRLSDETDRVREALHGFLRARSS